MKIYQRILIYNGINRNKLLSDSGMKRSQSDVSNLLECVFYGVIDCDLTKIIGIC